MHAVAGAALALGAPLGLLALRALQAGRLSPSWLRGEISADAWTYGYVTVSTLLVFALFGLAAGAGRHRNRDTAPDLAAHPAIAISPVRSPAQQRNRLSGTVGYRQVGDDEVGILGQRPTDKKKRYLCRGGNTGVLVVAVIDRPAGSNGQQDNDRYSDGLGSSREALPDLGSAGWRQHEGDDCQDDENTAYCQGSGAEILLQRTRGLERQVDARLLHPPATIPRRCSRSRPCLDEHVEAHHQTKCVLRPIIVDDRAGSA
jgi:hypothetical protein